MRHAVCLGTLLTALAAGCAIPQSPTGGPADETPPVVAEADPASQSVLVDTDRLTLVFSEYVDQASFAQAVSITPDFLRPPTYHWRKRAVTIAFPEPLAENTTYIVTIDTKLRDNNRVALKEPITIAFATGPEINRGKLEGYVRDPRLGAPLPSVDVFAYAAPDGAVPDSLPDRPAYRTQTDASGRFRFDYMSEQPYYVVALMDQNRNVRPDGIEPFAAPPDSVVVADTLGAPHPLPWLLTRLDSIPPEIQRARSLSNRRLSMRLSESVQLVSTDPARWSVRDSTSGDVFPVEAVYLRPEDPRQVYLVTAPLFATRHLVTPGGIADSSGNPILPAALPFTPSAAADTFQTYFVAFVPETSPALPAGEAYALKPGEQPGVRLSIHAPEERLRAIVSLADSLGNALPFTVATDDGVAFRLTPDPPLPPDVAFTLRVDGNEVGRPDTVLTRAYRYLGERAFGSLSGVARADSAAAGIVVELLSDPPSEGAAPQATVDGEGRFVFGGLPAQSRYRFRAFADRNGNRRWDGGAVLPYAPAEPLTWSTDSLSVRARWETELADTLHIEWR